MPTLPTITKRQDDILQLLYNYRFLNRTQLQAFLGHSTKGHTNRLLKDLSDKHYIEGKYSTKVGDNIRPAIYYLSLGAIQYFKSRPEAQPAIINRLYRDNDRSKDFINKCLLVADIALELQKARTHTLRFEVATPSMYANPESRAHFLTSSSVTPDAIVVQDKAGEYKAYMLEFLTPGMPVHRLHGKVNAYLDLYFSGSWEQNTGLDFPEIIIIAGSVAQLRETHRYLQVRRNQEPGAEDFQMKQILSSRLKATGISPYIDQEKTARH
jgi:hypothetical protein